MDQAEADAVVDEGKRADRDGAGLGLLEFAQQRRQPGGGQRAEATFQVWRNADQRDLGFAMISVGVEQVQVGIPADPSALPVPGVVIVAVSVLHGGVELAVTVAADRVNATPGLPGDRDALRNSQPEG